MDNNYEKRLIQIIKEQDWLMGALRAVRSLELPDWYIAAGAIRNTVWNVLHGYDGKLNIDVAYFDAQDLSTTRETTSEKLLRDLCSGLTFEVINQARAHLFDPNRQRALSSCDSISYWSETPTCVGIRLEKDNSLTVCAPYGLADLLELRVKPIPEPRRDMQLYERRVKEKQWNRTWSKLQIF